MNAPTLLLALGLTTAAGAADFAAWTHRQTVQVTAPALTRLELDPALLDASRRTGGAPFHDLRLISPAGVETPYALALPRLIRPDWVAADGFRARLEDNTTVLEFQPPAGETVSEVRLQTNAGDFIKSATLEASRDGTTWQTLSSGGILCRQNGTERLRLDVTPTPAAWTHFRVAVDDRRSPPIAFTGAQVRRDLRELRTVAQPVTIRARRETRDETRLILDLGTANGLLGTLRLRTPEPVFQREVSLFDSRVTLFRLQHEGRTAEEVDIVVDHLAEDREVELVIRNGDSPPLRIDGIEATRHPIPIVFQADAAGDWQLFIGNAQAAEPRYDLAALGERLRDATAQAAQGGTVEPNRAFRKTATAPEVGEEGTLLDVSAWSFRRAIEFKEAGVIEVELDPAVLARAESDLHDLRVVRDGRQIPFLVVRPGTQREVEAEWAAGTDPKHPSRTLWTIGLPTAGFPVTAVRLDSPTPLFDRTLDVIEYHDTEQGHVARHLGSARWQRTPGLPAQSLNLALSATPLTDTLQLATENGDNPPLQLASVRLVHPVVRVLFRAADTEPVHLCYGHRRALAPRYDLHLVRAEFEAATKVAGTLGGEEKLAGYKAVRSFASGKGSPWLWATLAVVVVALLWIVARMLPKPA